MRIRKLNEWKCDMDINDVYVKPEGVLGDIIDHFGLNYNPRTGCYDCDGDVNLRVYYNNLSYDEREAFDNAFVRNGKMTIRFGTVKGKLLLPGDDNKPYILTSLEGCPESVGDYFSCSHNQLTSLDGCPKNVGSGFYCHCNRLTSLKGCPKIVDGFFDCRYNQLTSLEGCPESVGGYFSCSYNQLTSLEGCPKKVGDDFYCRYNKKKFTEKDVTAVCNVKMGIYV